VLNSNTNHKHLLANSIKAGLRGDLVSLKLGLRGVTVSLTDLRALIIDLVVNSVSKSKIRIIKNQLKLHLSLSPGKQPLYSCSTVVRLTVRLAVHSLSLPFLSKLESILGLYISSGGGFMCMV